jgi:hypothetical protein
MNGNSAVAVHAIQEVYDLRSLNERTSSISLFPQYTESRSIFALGQV